MSAIFTNYFGVQNALNFEHFVTTTYANTYVTIGRNIDWPNGDTPPTPTNSANTFYTYWDSIIGLKKITAADMNLVIPRVDWASGVKYMAYNEDLDLFKKTDPEQIKYDYNFYCRNSKDQVFKCLANNYAANTETAFSTIMPEITIGGQLPENAYIETGDGYKWKYMYSIPPGLKQKFFTKDFMPVTSEPVVTDNAVDGRLDIFKIITKGAGYNNNTTASSLQIAKITGNGTDANITLRVVSTGAGGANVADVNIINGGSGYTTAKITITDPQKAVLTQEAVIKTIIGPPGGHGSDVAMELGASNIMVSVDIEGDENGTLPVGGTEVHGIRQIGILMDPRYSANNAFATQSVYRGTIKLVLNEPAGGDFVHDDTVYIGTDLASATFSGVVEHYDPSYYYLYLTNVTGSISSFTTLRSSAGPTAAVLNVEQPAVKKYSGKLLYIEDTSEIRRSTTENTQFKFTLRF